MTLQAHNSSHFRGETTRKFGRTSLATPYLGVELIEVLSVLPMQDGVQKTAGLRLFVPARRTDLPVRVAQPPQDTTQSRVHTHFGVGRTQFNRSGDNPIEFDRFACRKVDDPATRQANSQPIHLF
jgi:hypothetical protein